MMIHPIPGHSKTKKYDKGNFFFRFGMQDLDSFVIFEFRCAGRLRSNLLRNSTVSGIDTCTSSSVGYVQTHTNNEEKNKCDIFDGTKISKQ
jgi:hypothetical protein